MRLNDPEAVRREYATERGLAARKAAWRSYPTTGANPLEVVIEAVAERSPERVLEVGCGEGELAERVRRELGCEVVALDQSERMVELARARGVEAIRGDVQALPYADGTFDCAIAAWMLYHVPDVDRALGELRRVLRAAGRLVAVTNARDHVQELRALAGLERRLATPFDAHNAAGLLERHFDRVQIRDAGGTVTFPDHAAVAAYVRASAAVFERAARLADFDGPLVVTRHPVVFVADK